MAPAINLRPSAAARKLTVPSQDCGRDAHYWAPPAQNRTCSFPAYGSHLGCLTAGLAAFRTRSGTCDTLSRHCVRHVRHRFAVSLASALCSTASAAGHPALFGGFVATMAESDFSCPCIIGFRFLTFPMRASRLCSLWSDMRPLRFRRVPFGRDVAFDPGGATASRIAMSHMLPSTVPSVSASAKFFLSWLNPPPHPITVYASHSPSPTTAQHSLPGGALPPYRGRSFTGRIASASPDAPEPEGRIHFPPAESHTTRSSSEAISATLHDPDVRESRAGASPGRPRCISDAAMPMSPATSRTAIRCCPSSRPRRRITPS